MTWAWLLVLTQLNCWYCTAAMQITVTNVTAENNKHGNIDRDGMVLQTQQHGPLQD